MRNIDLVDVEVAIHDLAGIAVLVESVGHKIATIGTSKSDTTAFSQIAELILQKREILEEFFNDYMEAEKECKRIEEAEKELEKLNQLDPIKEDNKPFDLNEYDELIKKAPPKPDDEVSGDEPA